ncbi:MAG: WYL domain-containing protein [Solirubrobacteraceae bacterium]|nr:WYL domain-containing protein [Solirubrobacteraceae bacterium]
MPDVEEILALAVRQRRPVELEYRYRGQGLRTVHPRALYRTSNGTACDVYQVAGYTSKDRTVPGWRALDVDQIVSAEPMPDRFPLAPGYNPDAPRQLSEDTGPVPHERGSVACTAHATAVATRTLGGHENAMSSAQRRDFR